MKQCLRWRQRLRLFQFPSLLSSTRRACSLGVVAFGPACGGSASLVQRSPASRGEPEPPGKRRGPGTSRSPECRWRQSGVTPSPRAKMWIQVRSIDGSQTSTIEDVSLRAATEELRERVWALLDLRPKCQLLFHRGQAGEERPASPSGIRGEDSREPQGCVSWAGQRAWCSSRVQNAPGFPSGGQPAMLRVPALGTPRGHSGVPASPQCRCTLSAETSLLFRNRAAAADTAHQSA